MHSAANCSVSQYSGTPMPAFRQRRTSQITNSAFSACASPNEDWTKISDFEERRRIQSRIAQRNYRLKQKLQLERAEKQIELSSSMPELTHEELAIPGSASDLSHTDSQQQETQNFYDISTPEAPQQQCSPFSDDCVMPLQQFTPQLSTPQPLCAHASSSGTTSCLFHTGGQQQPAHNFYNSCTPKAPQQQCQPLNHDCVMLPQELTRQLSTSQPPCACTPTSGSASCHSQPGGQQQRMHSFYDRVPLCTSWAVSEDYTRALCGQFEPSCGTPAIDFNSPFVSPPHSSSLYMAVPPPTKRGCCCCHHNHTHPPAIEHALPMDSFDMHANHPY